MPTGYTPQSSIDRRKTLMNQLRQTPMNDTGKKTDWGRGLAHMLRQYQAGQMGREQEAEISRNAEIEQSEMAALMSRVGNPDAQSAQAAPDFSNMAITEGMDQGMVQGAQNNAASTPALPAFADMPATSPMAQALKQQQVLGNAASDRAAAQKMTELEYGRGSDAIKVGQQSKNRLSEILAQGVEQRLTQADKGVSVSDGSTLVRAGDGEIRYENGKEFGTTGGSDGSPSSAVMQVYKAMTGKLTTDTREEKELLYRLARGVQAKNVGGSIEEVGMPSFFDAKAATTDAAGNPLAAAVAGAAQSIPTTLAPKDELSHLSAAEKAKVLGRAEGEKEVGRGKFESTLASTFEKNGFLGKKINDARSNSGAWTTGLIGSVTSNIPGTSAYNLNQTLETIRANMGFDKLAEMKNNSPNGGALGQVSDRENLLLQAVWGSLQQSQSKEQFESNLDDLETQIQASWRRVATAYEKYYGAPFDASELELWGTENSSNKVGKDAHNASIARQKKIADMKAKLGE